MAEQPETAQLAERILNFMAGADLSQASMAKVLSVSSMSLKRWFNGGNMMPWVYNSVNRKMEILYREQQENNLFQQLHGLKQRDKVERLTGVLYNNLDWG